MYMFDQSLGTSYVINKPISFDIPTGTKGYTILMNKPAVPLTCRFFNSKGEMLSETTLDKPFSIIELPDKQVDKISLEGSAEIYEIIPNK